MNVVMLSVTTFLSVLLVDISVQQTLIGNSNNICSRCNENSEKLRILRKLALKNKEEQIRLAAEISNMQLQVKTMNSKIGLLQNASLNRPKPTDASLNRPKPTVSACDDSWIPYGISCFYIVKDKKKSWSKASDYCRTLNAELATLDTKSKNDFLAEKTQSSGNYWVGGNDLDKEGEWRWKSTGKKIGPYTNWYSNDPDGRSSQNCMWFVYQNKAEWIDAPCSSSKNFICEKWM